MSWLTFESTLYLVERGAQHIIFWLPRQANRIRHCLHHKTLEIGAIKVKSIKCLIAIDWADLTRTTSDTNCLLQCCKSLRGTAGSGDRQAPRISQCGATPARP